MLSFLAIFVLLGIMLIASVICAWAISNLLSSNTPYISGEQHSPELTREGEYFVVHCPACGRGLVHFRFTNEEQTGQISGIQNGPLESSEILAASDETDQDQKQQE